MNECDCRSLRIAHHGRGGCGLVHLVLGSLDFGLQVGRRVEVLALFPGAAALDVVHAHGDSVVVGVDHGAVRGVGEAAVVLPPRTVASLIFPTHLGKKNTRGRRVTSNPTRHKTSLEEEYREEECTGRIYISMTHQAFTLSLKRVYSYEHPLNLKMHEICRLINRLKCFVRSYSSCCVKHFLSLPSHTSCFTRTVRHGVPENTLN